MTDVNEPPSGPRSPAVRALIVVASVTALIVVGAYLAIDRLHAPAHNAVEHPGPPATNAQIQAEVVGHAHDVVAITGLRRPTAGYLLMPCGSGDDSPAQGAVYLDFSLPSDVNADQYFRGVAAAMVARGWREGPPPNQHLFGRNLSKDGVNALLYPNTDAHARGVARIYGQCHEVTDRSASSDWVDVSGALR